MAAELPDPPPVSSPLAADCRKPLTNGARYWAGSAAEWMLAWLVSEEASRFCSRAPTAAVPMTEPTWRTVLSMPEAAPAIRGSTSRMAIVVSGANVPPMPSPATISGARKSCQDECVPAMRTTQPIPMANRESPATRIHLPPVLSVSRPRNGARAIITSEEGAIVRPALSAEKPSADCK